MGITKKEKEFGLNEIFQKVSSFCAYRERSQQEVLDKLYGLGVSPDVANVLISRLIEENFLSEERFIRSFTGGKFRLKNWGRNKIKFTLSGKGISEAEIEKALDEQIDEETYRKTLKKLLEKKFASINEPDIFKKQQKVARYGVSKGYEGELVWEIINEIAKN
jgi:regulatory protein